MELFDVLLSMNPWWRKSEIYVPETKRDAFKEVKKLFDSAKTMISLQGLRRVGKSTLIFQLINEQIEKGTEAEEILYISLDDPRLISFGFPIIESYELWLKRFGRKKAYLFVDEAHFSKNFDLQLKRIYDNYRPKILFTGSASLFLKKGISESLAGRVISVPMKPLSFKEFLRFKGLEVEGFDSLEVAVDDSYKLPVEIFNLFQEYLLIGGFPETITLDPEIAKRYLRETFIERVLLKDIPTIFGNVDTLKLLSTFAILAESAGNKVNFTKISNSLNLKVNTVMKYTDYIKSAGLMHFIQRMSKSVRTRRNIMPKVYLAHPSIAGAFSEVKLDKGILVENAIANHLKDDIYYWEGKKEVDFLANGMPIEVKYSNKPELALKNIKELSKYIEFKKAVVITRDTLKKETTDDKVIFFIPVAVFLLIKNS
ncbi:MAG: ATP-binding protein [Petrotogales bacterium]